MKRKLILISLFFFLFPSFACSVAERQERANSLQLRSQEEYEVWNEVINYFLSYFNELGKEGLENKQENGSEVTFELSGVYEETISKDTMQRFLGITFAPHSFKSYLFSKLSTEIQEGTVVDFINKNQISHKLDRSLKYKLISAKELDNIFEETKKMIMAMESKQIDNFSPYFLLHLSRAGFNQKRTQALVYIEWYAVPPLTVDAVILLLKKDKVKWSVAATYSESKT